MDYDYELYDGDIPAYEDSYYDGGEDDQVPVTLRQLFDLCLKPSVCDSLKSVSYLFVWCLVYRSSTLFIPSISSVRHIISFLTGLLSLHALFTTSIYYIASLVILTYVLLFLLTFFQCRKYQGVVLILCSLSFLCVCELWLVEPKQWHRIRGSQMIIVMKSVSLAFDLDNKRVKEIPNLVQYAGYMLCPSSCVFGPWLSFNDYKSNYNGNRDLKSIGDILIKSGLTILFLTISTCWSEYFIPMGTQKWFAAYREALSFRTSHYFVSYLSEVMLLLGGHWGSGFSGVTKPLNVEFPRSIVNVVIYWNIPMHNWLKIYVFNTSRKFGNFFAIISTYTVSSLLHGINFQLSVVLFSLGIYSYVEVMLRKKLAAAFSACILAKSCKAECSHTHKKNHPLVLGTNVFFLLLTVFHLAYLGVVFNAGEEEEIGYTWRHSLRKWGKLNYLSHYVAFLTYTMYFLIR